MKLRYHRSENFGDALNPIIWDHFLPDFFDNDESILFIGFGTLLGFDFPEKSKKIVFSTGAALDEFGSYGRLPKLNKNWIFKCVRGPKTADLLDLNIEKSVVDAAVLIREMITKKVSKEYSVSYMPHVASLEFYRIKNLCEKNGIKFISPKSNCYDIIDDILKSEVIICEAMHGAIVADALDVPWVPLKMFRQVNEFKWYDWSQSLKIVNFNFFRTNELYSKEYLTQIFKNKILVNSTYLSRFLASIYFFYQENFIKKKVIRKMKIASQNGRLSDRKILSEKISILKGLINDLKDEYSHDIK